MVEYYGLHVSDIVSGRGPEVFFTNYTVKTN